MISECPVWIVRVVGHADGVSYHGPFIDKSDAIAFECSIDDLPEFGGYDTVCILPVWGI